MKVILFLGFPSVDTFLLISKLEKLKELIVFSYFIFGGIYLFGVVSSPNW